MNRSRLSLWRAVPLLAAFAAAGNAAPPARLHVRLETEIGSYTARHGSAFKAVVIAPYTGPDGEVLIPSHSTVSGVVRSVARVGIGVVHERAHIDLSFEKYELPDGRTFPFNARLLRVDNAREEVSRDGRIKGVLAANSATSLLQGLWFRPRMKLLPTSLFGLTGASGMIWTRYSLGPLGAAAIFAVRCAMFRMPEPEIAMPAGTELDLVLLAAPERAPEFAAAASGHVGPDLDEWLSGQPFTVRRPKGEPADDIVNLAFVGTRDELLDAFHVAGWEQAEPLNRKSYSRTYAAYMGMHGYPTAPVSPLLYDGREPDLVLEKSFNTIARRHHVRIWQAQTSSGQPVWLGAATHDTGIALNRSSMTVTHKVFRHIDIERSKVVNDLEFANCADPAAYVDRRGAARHLTDGEPIETDGRLAVLALHTCAVPPPPLVVNDKPGSPLSRVARRVMLETKQYLLRSNVYYRTWELLHHRHTQTGG